MLGHQVIGGALAALLLLWAPLAHAAEGAQFLKIGVGARGIGMGDAYTAMADDADSVYWNPAGLARMSRPQVGMSRAVMFLGDTFDSVSFGLPLGSREKLRTRDRQNARIKAWETVSRGTLGFGVTRLSQGTQEGRSADRSRTGDFDSGDMAITVGYALPITKRFNAGVAVKRIESRIADSKASTYAMDFGATTLVGASQRWRLGASVRNLGHGLQLGAQRSELPLTVAGGAAVRIFHGLMLAGELQVRPYGERSTFNIGMEYSVIPTMTLRAGYQREQAENGVTGQPIFGSLGGGMGLTFGRYALDYSVTPFGELGNVQRVSLGAGF